MTNAELVQLVVTVVQPLVRQPERVVVSLAETARFRQIKVTVAPPDVGRVIGRQGRVAAALRMLIASLPERPAQTKRVRLMIDDNRH